MRTAILEATEPWKAGISTSSLQGYQKGGTIAWLLILILKYQCFLDIFQ